MRNLLLIALTLTLLLGFSPQSFGDEGQQISSCGFDATILSGPGSTIAIPNCRVYIFTEPTGDGSWLLLSPSFPGMHDSVVTFVRPRTGSESAWKLLLTTQIDATIGGHAVLEIRPGDQFTLIAVDSSIAPGIVNSEWVVVAGSVNPYTP